MLLPMVDGGILKVNYDSHSSSGCETCDYGSSYINEFSISMTTGRIEIEIDNMYEYAVSESYMMETILYNVDEIKTMTELQFSSWLEKKMNIDVGYDIFEFIESFDD